jgi:hypothetical protein
MDKEKIIKLADSAYKILEFFPEADPIKNKAKEKILSVFESSVLFFKTDAKNNKDRETAEKILIDTDIFLGYLEIAKNQKWLDNLNFLILQKEFENLKNEIGALFVLKDNFLKTEKDRKLEEPAESEKLSERQKKIIEILQNSEKAQVSDIIKILPDVTKRTIRRDMDELMEKGRIIRMGGFNQTFYKIC